MQGRSVVNSQLKLSQLKNYLSKVVTEKNAQNVLNQEFLNIVEKLRPATVHFWRVFDLSTFTEDKKKRTEVAAVKEATKETTKSVVPKWKQTRLDASRESVIEHTKRILTLITHAHKEQVLKRIEDFNCHLKKYPDAKHMAEKLNAVRLLLRIKRKVKNEEVSAGVSEALTLLGYSKPVSGRGIRILSIDGGGIRGILVIEMLKKLEELTSKRTRDMFDIICGVSTGAIIASLIGARNLTLDEVYEVYTKLSTQIFTQSALKGTSNLVWSHSYYDTALWEKLLQENVGDCTLIGTSRDPRCPKLCFLSSVINQSPLSAYIFRNYTFPCHVQSKYDGGHEHLVWEAVRASAAAPTYFEEFKLGNMLHQDGGILFNNPTAVAIHEARLLWPEAPLQCVLSFGTGRSIALPPDPLGGGTVSNSSWKSKFYAVIESATDTESVHTTLTDLLPEKIYYRFNPYLTEMLDMAEIDSGKLEQLRRDAVMYLRRNEDKFQEAAKVLSYQKTLTQKAVEWLDLQREIQGLKLVR